MPKLQSEPLLEIRNLTVTLGPTRVLDNVSFDVFLGQLQVVIGPNGGARRP